jgi:hypothetical protein
MYINTHIIFQGFQVDPHLENADTLNENQPLILTGLKTAYGMYMLKYENFHRY